jgi:transposase
MFTVNDVIFHHNMYFQECCSLISLFAMPKLSVVERAQIVVLVEEGLSYRDLAMRFNVRPATISDLIKKQRTTGCVDDKSRCGGPRKTTIRDDRSLVMDALRHPRLGSRELKRRWEESIGKTVSIRTVEKRLRSSGVKSYVAQKKPLLSLINRRRRLLWARQHRDWTIADWNQVCFSDETPLHLIQCKQRRFYRSRSAPSYSRLNTVTARPTVQAGGGHVMVWGAFSYAGIVPLRRVAGSLNTAEYCSILHDRVLPIIQHHPDIIFQQDNAPAHKSNLTRQWFAQHGVNVMEWPAQSPDLNPMENAWSVLKGRLEKEEIHGKELLMQRAQELWMTTDIDIINKLIASMPNRVSQVIKNHGGPIDY